jgi:hypothetical protein
MDLGLKGETEEAGKLWYRASRFLYRANKAEKTVYRQGFKQNSGSCTKST